MYVFFLGYTNRSVVLLDNPMYYMHSLLFTAYGRTGLYKLNYAYDWCVTRECFVVCSNRFNPIMTVPGNMYAHTQIRQCPVRKFFTSDTYGYTIWKDTINPKSCPGFECHCYEQASVQIKCQMISNNIVCPVHWICNGLQSKINHIRYMQVNLVVRCICGAVWG